jgi:MFS family permease
MVILGFYPLILSMTHTAIIYYFVSIVGGLAWSLAGGTLFNYMLERVPGNDRPAHLAWFNLGANSAVLIGSLLGPAISEMTGIIPALIIFAILRMAAGTAIIRWG